MANGRRKFVSDPTTGFGTSSTQSGERFYRKDGSVNVLRKGIPFLERFSWFHTLLSISVWKFWVSLAFAFVVINLLFGMVYYWIGMEHLDGVRTGSVWTNFAQVFFFSAQTFTTVGYGHISPVGLLTSAVAAFEAFLGWLGFALASGLFYGRFSKPQPFLIFSDMALIAPYKGGKAFMFRTASYKNNHLTDAEVRLTLAVRIKEGERVKNEFYPLQVEFSKINSLVLNWTIVHPINEDSPFAHMTLEELKEARAEVMVFLKAFDEVFANTVVARTSYTVEEFIEGAKFRPMYHSAHQSSATVLNIDKINDFERV